MWTREIPSEPGIYWVAYKSNGPPGQLAGLRVVYHDLDGHARVHNGWSGWFWDVPVKPPELDAVGRNGLKPPIKPPPKR